MGRFIIGSTGIGEYNGISLEDLNKVSGEVLVILINKDSKIGYSGIKVLLRCLQRFNRVEVVSIECLADVDDSYKLLCSMLISNLCYNIYEVTGNSEKFVTEDYLDTISNRQSSIAEVSNLLMDSDVLAEDFSLILKGITDIVTQGTPEGLCNFVTEHESDIVRAGLYFEKIKAIAGEFSVKSLESKVNQLEQEKDAKKLENDTLKRDLRALKDENKDLKYKAEVLTEKIGAVKEVGGAEDNSRIKMYNTFNTKLQASGGAKCVIYFREVSKIPYINTFINFVEYALTKEKKNVMVLIFDPCCGVTGIYDNIQIVNNSEYSRDRARLCGIGINKLVLTEPSAIALKDIVGNSKRDVVIVYDRMRGHDDLITGNNVYRFWVASSSNDLSIVRKSANTREIQNIFIREQTRFEDNEGHKYFAIRDNPDMYTGKGCTDAAKMAMYTRMENGVSCRSLAAEGPIGKNPELYMIFKKTCKVLGV